MRLFFALVVMFGTFTFVGGRDLWLALKANSEPDRLTAKQLIERGADGNPYVEVSEFFLGENFVYEENDGSWTLIWLPVAPVENQNAPLASVKLVLKTNAVGSLADFPKITSLPVLRGMVMNHIESISKEQHRLLASSYPGTNIDEVLVFNIDKSPGNMKQMGGTFFGIGLAGLLVMAVVGYRVYR